MRLLNASLHDIKNRAHRLVDLAPITYIQGDNRSGKTAISQAIQFAIFGKSDEVGAKSSGDLVANGVGSGHVVVNATGYMFNGLIEFKSKGSVSVKRSCTPSGSSLQVSDKDVAEMLGPVPPTVSQLLELTGEELWQLAMPDSMGEIPEYVIKMIASAVTQVSDLNKKTSGITTALSELEKLLKLPNFRDGALVTEYSTLLGDLKRELSALTKACLVCADTKNLKPYNGEPVADLKKEIAAIDEQVKNLTNDMTLGNSNKELLAQKERDFERQQAIIRSNKQVLLERSDDILFYTKSQASVVAFEESCSDVFFGAESDVSVTIDSLFTGGFSTWIKHRLEKYPDSEFTKLVTEFIGKVSELANESIYRAGEDPLLDQLIENVQDSFKLSRPCALDVLDERWRKSVVQSLGTGIENLEKEVKETKALIAKQESALQKLMKERDEAKVKSQIHVDAELLAELRERRKTAAQKVADAEQYKTALDNAVASRAAASQIEAIYPSVDGASSHLQQFRKTNLEAGLDKIQAKANEIITACGLSPLILEPSSGKRPALIIKNELGTKFSVMSGAERLIVGASFIRAVQSVCNVVLPLLFIEGGELDGKMVCAFVKALAEFDPGGNVIISHWFLGDFNMSQEVVKVHHA